jgi:putative phage-type endonuclease
MSSFKIPGAEEILAPTHHEDPEWHALRRTGVGASEAAPLMGEGYTGTSAATVWEGKVSDEEPEFDESTLRLFERGHALEPIAADKFLNDHPTIFARKSGLLRSLDNPYMLATPDRLLTDGGGLELKTAHGFAFNRYDPDVPPRMYYWQTVHSLRVTGLSHWWIYVLHPDTFKTLEYRIDASDRQVAADMDLLDATVVDFWESYVVPRVRPGDDATREPIAAPRDGLDLSTTGHASDLLPLLRRRVEVSGEIKALSDEKKIIDAALKDAADGHAEVHLDGRSLWKITSSTRTGVDTDRLKKDHPEIYADYLKTTNVRSLNITAKF